VCNSTIISCFQNVWIVTVPDAAIAALPVAATRDVDLCMGATPEKRPRLDICPSDTNASVPSVQEDVNSKLTEFQFSCLVIRFLSFGGGLFL
jgi:hypothetical protein